MLPGVAVCRAGLYLWLRGRPSCCRVWRASGSALVRGMTCHIAIFCHIICPPERSYASVFACRESDAWLLTLGRLFMRIRGA